MRLTKTNKNEERSRNKLIDAFWKKHKNPHIQFVFRIWKTNRPSQHGAERCQSSRENTATLAITNIDAHLKLSSWTTGTIGKTMLKSDQCPNIQQCQSEETFEELEKNCNSFSVFRRWALACYRFVSRLPQINIHRIGGSHLSSQAYILEEHCFLSISLA